MSRDLTSDMATEIARSAVRPFLLYQATFASGDVFYWNGPGDLSWNSQTWTGAGDLIQIPPVDETDDVKAQGVSITVSGSSASNVALTLAEVQSGQPGIIYLGFFDSAGAIIADPQIIFRGRLDSAVIDDSNPEQPVLVLSYEHELVDLERPRERRYTDEAQQALYPGDTGLRCIATLQDQQIYWGQV